MHVDFIFEYRSVHMYTNGSSLHLHARRTIAPVRVLSVLWDSFERVCSEATPRVLQVIQHRESVSKYCRVCIATKRPSWHLHARHTVAPVRVLSVLWGTGAIVWRACRCQLDHLVAVNTR